MVELSLPASSGYRTLAHRLYDVLEEAIISGAIEPGSRLHVDELAKRFGVSRIPVRDDARA